MRRRSFALASLGLLAPMDAGISRAAEAFPNRPITTIVPWPERGVVDVITRAVTTNVSRRWGVPINIVNNVGGDGALGTDAVATSAPNGYTWLIGTLTTLTAPYVVKDIYSNPLQHFSGAAMLAASSLVAVVPSSLAVNSLKDFVEWAKGRGKLQYLNPGTGSASYLNTELLAGKEHLDILVPKRTPADITRQISAAVNQAIAGAGVREKIEATGGAVFGAKTPPEIDAYLTSQDNRWARFFKTNRIVPE